MTYRIYLLSYKTEFLKYKAVGMVEPIDLDDDFALRRAISNIRIKNPIGIFKGSILGI